MRNTNWKPVSVKVLLGALILLAWAPPGSAVFGVRRRTAIVAASAGEAAGASKQAAADQQSAAAQQQQAAAQQSAAAQQQAAAQSAAAAQQAAAAAQQAAAAASKASAQPAAAQKTPQQKLQDLENLYKQGLITEADYNAAKQKIINEMTQ